MLKQRRSLLDVGLTLLIAGVVVQIALKLAAPLLGVLASVAIVAGIVLAIMGLVMPGKRI